jgi:hypothetical protein
MCEQRRVHWIEIPCFCGTLTRSDSGNRELVKRARQVPVENPDVLAKGA